MASENSKPKVSVIIPCYNQGQYVDEAVDSVLDSTFRDFEIVIVNDGSTDEFTNEKLKNYQKEKTRIVHSENRGLPGARNLAIREANGEYILPLDSDDMIEKTYLEKAVKILNDHPVVGFVYAWKKNFEKINTIHKLPEINTKNILLENFVGSSTGMYRKSSWEKVGGYSEDMKIGYQDWEFWINMIEHGFRPFLIKEPLFLYRVRENSMVSNSNKIENRKLIISQIIDKHFELYKEKFKNLLVDFVSGEKVFIDNKEFIKKKNENEQAIAIMNSKFWKLTLPFRKIFDFIKYKKNGK